MSDLMQKFLDGELSEFEAERLERELESVDSSEKMLALAQLRYQELEVQAAKSPLRRAVEAWVAWFARASAAALGRSRLALRMAAAAVAGATAGAVGYALFFSAPVPATQATVPQPVAKVVQAPAMAAKVVLPKEKAVVASAPLEVEEAGEVEVEVVKNGGVQPEEVAEPVLEGYDPGPLAAAPAKLKEDLTIEVRLRHSQRVSVQIVDSNGSLTKTVHTGELPKGTWFFFLDEKDKAWRNMPAGAYFVEVDTGGQMLRRNFNVTSRGGGSGA